MIGRHHEQTEADRTGRCTQIAEASLADRKRDTASGLQLDGSLDQRIKRDGAMQGTEGAMPTPAWQTLGVQVVRSYVKHYIRHCCYCGAKATIANAASLPVYIEWKCVRCGAIVSDDLLPEEVVHL